MKQEILSTRDFNATVIGNKVAEIIANELSSSESEEDNKQEKETKKLKSEKSKNRKDRIRQHQKKTRKNRWSWEMEWHDAFKEDRWNNE